MKKKSSLKKIIKYSLILILLIVVIYLYFAKPYQIARGNVDTYKNGQIVLAITRKILINTPIQAGDIVVFKLSSTFGQNGIGMIVGVPGDNGKNASYFSGEEVGNTVPNGFYLLEYSGFIKAVPESQITSIVWFPIRSSRGPVEVRGPAIN
jgi:hypothetical protein